MKNFTYNDYLRGLSDDELDKELWKIMNQLYIMIQESIDMKGNK